MITRQILTFTAAALLAVPFVHGQAPATEPAPATGAATAPAAKAKPLSMGESKALIDLLDLMQFHIQMGLTARHKDKDDKELVTFANKIHKEMTEQFTPLVTVAMNNNLKNIPAAVSKNDKAEIAKLGKVKADKWKQEYFEMLAKNGKRNARAAENAVKSFQDPELKATGGKVAALISSQAAEAEAKAKELKERK